MPPLPSTSSPQREANQSTLSRPATLLPGLESTAFKASAIPRRVVVEAPEVLICAITGRTLASMLATCFRTERRPRIPALRGSGKPSLVPLRFAGTCAAYVRAEVSTRSRSATSASIPTGAQGLSVREIEVLARGFSQGGDALRAEIVRGDLALPPARMKEAAGGADGSASSSGGCCATSRSRTSPCCGSARRAARLSSGPFHAQAHLLTEGILCRADGFVTAVRSLHDRGRPA